MAHPYTLATDRLAAFPAAWYTVGSSRQLKPGQLMPFELCGIPLVLYRTASGRFCAMEDRCPHLGGRFSAGGRVQGEQIECPVHLFRFSPQGQCEATGYGVSPPAKACTHPWHTDEVNGLLLVYYHPAGEPPTWCIPAEDTTGWSAHTLKHFDIGAHPQLVAEGIADKGHLVTVHGYHDVSMDSPFDTEAHRIQVNYSFSNLRSVLGDNPLGRLFDQLLDSRLRVEFAYQAHGLGYSSTELYIPKFNIRTRHLVNPTPLGEGRTRLFASMAIQHLAEPGKISPLLARLPEPWVRKLMFAFLWHGYLHDLKDDIAVWENLAPLAQPALSQGDGPIAKFRRWAGQFYPAEAH